MISDAALSQLKADNPCDELAARFVRLRKHGKKLTGPCPMCSKDRQSKTDSRFDCNFEGWTCAACSDGGDCVALVMRIEGCDFKGAVEWLGGARESNPAETARREQERTAANEEREREAQQFRERERGTLHDIWNHAIAPAGTAVEAYLAVRGLPLPPDAGKRLRCVPEMPYFLHGGRDAPVLWRGPAMVAPIVGPDGKFKGLHFTYLDPSEPKGKARILHPETGELMPAKKVRGTKAGGSILLVKPPQPATRSFIGEGIETVLTVWHALNELGRDLLATEFRSAIDLGNLGGKAAATIVHPTLKDAAGRARRVPGPDPVFSSPAIAVSPEITDIVLLGDGDSDPVVTRCALHRAQMRTMAEVEERSVRVAWAPEGIDFNDMLMTA
jgi:CHC2 zinc finger